VVTMVNMRLIGEMSGRGELRIFMAPLRREAIHSECA
jgi:hypothetical protein